MTSDMLHFTLEGTGELWLMPCQHLHSEEGREGYHGFGAGQLF